MDYSKISGIIFDFDDTLQDRESAFRKYAAGFLERHFGGGLAPDEAERRVDEMTKKINGGYVDKREFFMYFKTQWDWKDAPSFKEFLHDYSSIFPTYSTLFDDAAGVLHELKRSGYKIGVLTNGLSEMQNLKLRVSGVSGLVDVSVVSGDYGIEKPDRRIFDIISEKMGIDNERLLFVGDHPVNDIQGALGAGMKAVKIKKGVFADVPAPAGVQTIDRLSELPALLHAFSPSPA